MSSFNEVEVHQGYKTVAELNLGAGESIRFMKTNYSRENRSVQFTDAADVHTNQVGNYQLL